MVATPISTPAPLLHRLHPRRPFPLFSSLTSPSACPRPQPRSSKPPLGTCLSSPPSSSPLLHCHLPKVATELRRASSPPSLPIFTGRHPRRVPSLPSLKAGSATSFSSMATTSIPPSGTLTKLIKPHLPTLPLPSKFPSLPPSSTRALGPLFLPDDTQSIRRLP